MKRELLHEVLEGFNIPPDQAVFQAVEQGYINDTFIVNLDDQPTFVLQKINHKVFEEPVKLQSNIDNALKNLADENYVKIEFLESNQGSSLYRHHRMYWRLMKFIPDSRVFNSAEDENLAFEAGLLIGKFHRLMSNEKSEDYHVIIKDFHNLKFRVSQFQQALDFADHLTLMDAQNEVNYAFSTIPEFNTIDLNNLPLRICHNDAKLNNMLFNSGKTGLCLIDLDTIMPGYMHYDMGDALRTVVNPASEDETDLSKIELRTDLYHAFINGLRKSELKLTSEEINIIPLSMAYMPFLHGLRALTDFLNGNIYYKVNYAEHNLDRARNLFQFTKLALERNQELREATIKLF